MSSNSDKNSRRRCILTETADRQNHITTRRLTIMVSLAERSRTNIQVVACMNKRGQHYALENRKIYRHRGILNAVRTVFDREPLYGGGYTGLICYRRCARCRPCWLSREIVEASPPHPLIRCWPAAMYARRF